MIHRNYFLILMMFGVVGCIAPSGSGSSYAYTANTDVSKAVVTNYRVGSFVGAALTEYLYANGEFVAHIVNGGFKTTLHEPGKIEYRKLERAVGLRKIGLEGVLTNTTLKTRHGLSIEVEAGREYYIRWKPKAGKGLVGTVTPKDEALRELSKLKEFQFDGEVKEANELGARKTRSAE